MSERMFIAIWAQEVADRIQQLQHRLQNAEADVNWTDPEQLHFTVKFLGETTLLHAAKVCRALSQIAADYPRCDLQVLGVGAFPKIERPRTLWAGMGTGAQWLKQVHEAVDEAMADLHYLPDSRFTPHLTIGRARTFRNADKLRKLLETEGETSFGVVGATELVLVSSRLEADGPVYEVVGRAPLKG